MSGAYQRGIEPGPRGPGFFFRTLLSGMARARRVPLFRIGLTLLIGSVAASLIHYYLAMGTGMADMGGGGVSTEPRDLVAHFVRNVLFVGAVPGALFYCGAAFMVLGIIRNLTGTRSGGAGTRSAG